MHALSSDFGSWFVQNLHRLAAVVQPYGPARRFCAVTAGRVNVGCTKALSSVQNLLNWSGDSEISECRFASEYVIGLSERSCSAARTPGISHANKQNVQYGHKAHKPKRKRKTL
jgi:hypothetical protein